MRRRGEGVKGREAAGEEKGEQEKHCDYKGDHEGEMVCLCMRDSDHLCMRRERGRRKHTSTLSFIFSAERKRERDTRGERKREMAQGEEGDGKPTYRFFTK